ncbi:MAG: Crp/Fnr family transcriptional regulator [Bacteroidetes bacterium]|nr:Crp/Fnr family transcriptional regulator [Bacteroidota bacterium]
MASNKAGNWYKKGQNVFFEGNRPAGLYCLNKGKVKVFKLGYEGKEQIIRLAKEGDILGYRALISGESYTASATALEDCQICFIPKSIFFSIMGANSELSMRMMHLLAHDLKSAENHVAEMAQKSVRERLAETLLMLKENYSEEENNGVIGVSLSREDLANLVGTATETIIRLLSDFKDERLIDLSGRKIKILNQNALVKTARVYD